MLEKGSLLPIIKLINIEKGADLGGVRGWQN